MGLQWSEVQILSPRPNSVISVPAYVPVGQVSRASLPGVPRAAKVHRTFGPSSPSRPEKKPVARAEDLIPAPCPFGSGVLLRSTTAIHGGAALRAGGPNTCIQAARNTAGLSVPRHPLAPTNKTSNELRVARAEDRASHDPGDDRHSREGGNPGKYSPDPRASRSLASFRRERGLLYETQQVIPPALRAGDRGRGSISLAFSI